MKEETGGDNWFPDDEFEPVEEEEGFNVGVEYKPLSESEKELLEYLRSAPALYTPIGSNALFENTYSDFDFVCLNKNITNFIIDRTIAFDIRNYVNVVPMGNGWLFKTDNENIDILVYEEVGDVNAIKKTMQFFQSNLYLLDEFLGVKENRVRMFESLYRKYQNFERSLNEI
jgi:hypothetical protein